jgi:LysM repeat protein
MNKVYLKVLSILVFISILVPSGFVRAQDTSAAGPVYIVQEGDSLWDIAYRFHVSQQDLANANGIVDANQIAVGQQLVIPGLEGLRGVLTTESVPLGETLHSLSLRYHLPEDKLAQLNHVTSPDELYAGYSIVIPQVDNPPLLGKRVAFLPGQSLL